MHIAFSYDIVLNFVCLDDTLLLAPPQAIAKEQFKPVVVEIKKAGLSFNLDKSVLVPTSVITHRGVEVDLEAKNISAFC